LPVEGLVDVGRNCVGDHGDAGIEIFDLFLSAFGFFFSRLLLNCPFAISSSRLHALGRRPHHPPTDVLRERAVIAKLLRDG
jgi:hypothetical protein